MSVCLCVYACKLTLAEEFTDKKKKCNFVINPFIGLLFFLGFFSFCGGFGCKAAANSPIIENISVVLERQTGHLLVCVCIAGLYMQPK